MPGRQLVGGRYRLLRRIGAGGMGVVHEARDTAIDRRVAVKVLSVAAGVDAEEMTERLHREARALARVAGPATPTLYDFGTLEGSPYLVMEYLDGVELETLVRHHGRLPDAAVVGIGVGVCSCLAAAHAAGVLHRDVKPSNVRITTQGRVVLQDFGLARLVEETAITAVGALIGTPRYMAPEVMRGERPGVASDLYGLGLCMYLMLTGEPPLAESQDVGAVVEAAVDRGTYRLTGGPFQVHAQLAELVDALSAREPHQRPPQANAALAALLPLHESAQAVRLLGELVRQCVRDGAVAYVHNPPAEADTSLPEYLDRTSDTPPAETPTPTAGGHGHGALAAPPSASSPLSLSDLTRRVVLDSMTADTAVSRQREAVNLVLRGELQDAVRVLTSVVEVCAARLGTDHPTTLTGRYWQAVCLARLGARGEALALFSDVSARTE